MPRKLQKTIIIIIGYFFLLVLFQVNGFAANDQVPIDIARKVALVSAEEIFGPVRIIDHKTCYNLDDEPEAYVFILYKKTGPLPTLDSIKGLVSAQRAKLLELNPIGDEAPPQRAARIAGDKGYWNKLRREEDFVTVVTGANYGQLPVIQAYSGLPPYITTFEDAEDAAETALDKMSLHPGKLRYVSPLRFELEFSDASEKRILVSPLDFKVRDVDTVAQNTAAETSLQTDDPRRIAEKWAVFKHDLPGLKIGTENNAPDKVDRAAALAKKPLLSNKPPDHNEGSRHTIEVQRGYIPKVPDYQKIDYRGEGDCAPTATACVLGYWQAHGYERLIDSGNVAQLVEEIKNNSDYDFINGGASLESITESLETICNAPDLNNNYGFSATFIKNVTFSDYESEILAGRPPIHNCNHKPYGKHSLAGVGFLETPRIQWCIDHDNWASTPEDIYIEWSVLKGNSLITVVPGIANNKTISGYVKTADGVGIPDVTITFVHYNYQDTTWMSDGTATTDHNGHYSLNIYYCWNGKAEPAKDSFTFSPANLTFEDITADRPEQNFTCSQASAPQ